MTRLPLHVPLAGLVLTLLVTSPANSQEPSGPLDIESLVARAAVHDAAIRAAELYERSALLGRRLLRAQVQPQVTLGSPANGGSFDWSRSDVSSTPASSSASSTVQRRSMSLGARLGVSQSLPTDGLVTLGVQGSLQRRLLDGEEGFTQSVALSAGLEQPLLTNGKIIDFAMFEAGQELAAEVPLRLARGAAEVARNDSLVAAVEAFLTVIELRNQIRVLEMNIQTAGRRIEQLRLRAQQGTVTGRTVWDSEVTLDELRESRLEAEYALSQTEFVVAGSVGVDSLDRFTDISSAIPVLPGLSDEEEAVEAALEHASIVRQARIGVEQRRLQQVVDGRRYAATLSAQVTLASPSNEEPFDTVGESYQELFSEDATWTPSVSLGLSVPVYTGNQALLRRMQNQAAIDRSLIELEEARRRVRRLVRGLYLRRRLLTDQLAARKSALTLQRERLSERETLAQLDSITDLDLQEAVSVVAARENAVWKTEADLFLNGLRIFSATGMDLFQLFGVDQ